jgi:hypothetical protein
VDIAYLSAVSALAGSVVGGLTTGLTAWISQRAVAKAAFAAREMSIRQELFRDFIATASKAYGEAIVSGEPQIQELVSLYAIISKMRVLCSPRIIECRSDYVRDGRNLLRTECDHSRNARADAEWGRAGRRSAEGIQRGGA